MTKKDVEQLVEIIFDSIISTLNKGEKIELRGFGSFRVRERNARKGRNPNKRKIETATLISVCTHMTNPFFISLLR